VGQPLGDGTDPSGKLPVAEDEVVETGDVEERNRRYDADKSASSHRDVRVSRASLCCVLARDSFIGQFFGFSGAADDLRRADLRELEGLVAPVFQATQR